MTAESAQNREQLVRRIISSARPIAVVTEGNGGYMPIVLEPEPQSPEAKFILTSLVNLYARITQREEELLRQYGHQYADKRKRDPILITHIFNRDLLLGRTGDVHTPVLLRKNQKTGAITELGVYSFGTEKESDFWSIVLTSRETVSAYQSIAQNPRALTLLDNYLSTRKAHEGESGPEFLRALPPDFNKNYDLFLEANPQLMEPLRTLFTAVSQRYQAKASF